MEKTAVPGNGSLKCARCTRKDLQQSDFPRSTRSKTGYLTICRKCTGEAIRRGRTNQLRLDRQQGVRRQSSKPRRRLYTIEFMRETVQKFLAADNKAEFAQIAGIHISTLHRWAKEQQRGALVRKHSDVALANRALRAANNTNHRPSHEEVTTILKKFVVKLGEMGVDLESLKVEGGKIRTVYRIEEDIDL